MSMKGLFCKLVVLIALAMPARAAVLDQSFTSLSGDGAQIGITYDGLAQTFTVGRNGVFHSAELLLSQASPTPVSNLTISLLDTLAGAPNSVIASLSVVPGDVSSTPNVFLPILANFSAANYLVHTGDVLAVAISSPTGNGYAWNAGVDAFATYAGGQRFHDFAGGGVTWSPEATWDFSLKTYVTVPEPGTLGLLGVGITALGLMQRKRT